MNIRFGGGKNPFRNFAEQFAQEVNNAASGGDSGAGNQPPHPPKEQKPTSRRGIIVRIVLFLVVLAAGYYVAFPPINIQSSAFWSFAGTYLVIGLVLSATVTRPDKSAPVFTMDGKSVKQKKRIRLPKLLAVVLGVGIAAYVLLSLAASPVIQSRNYAAILGDTIETKQLDEYTPTIKNVPLLDRDSAERLANRALGNLVDEVSQFVLGGSVQITVDQAPVRVCPLEYEGLIKWFINRGTGIPAYITVDMKKQSTQIVRLQNGMHYSPSGYLNDNLLRHVQFRYPTAMLDNPKFELDEDGNPHWVIPVLKHRICLLRGTDVKGVIVCDPVTGDTAYYNIGAIPDWIDNVYSPDLVIQQYNWYGVYRNGFINSIIGQKGVVRTTEGYNYIPKDNDIYSYTGVTSVVSDESNIGFIFTDLRTRETEYYEIAGAEEYSAMESAEGVVQHLNYNATFPLLLSIEGQLTYTVALKDDAGLVKMYGMVNMNQYQIVATGKTIQECQANYRQLLIEEGQQVTEEEVVPAETYAVGGTIAEIRSAVVSGTTWYYLRLDSDAQSWYALSAAQDERAVLLSTGDAVELDAVAEQKGQAIVQATLKAEE